MLEYVHISAVTDELLDAIMVSYAAAPPFDRPTKSEVRTNLVTQHSHLFRFGKGLTLVSVRAVQGKRRLYIDAITQPGGNITAWAREMKRLAAEWLCDTIETTVFNPRLASAIERCGARQEAVVLVLQVRE